MITNKQTYTHTPQKKNNGENATNENESENEGVAPVRTVLSFPNALQPTASRSLRFHPRLRLTNAIDPVVKNKPARSTASSRTNWVLHGNSPLCAPDNIFQLLPFLLVFLQHRIHAFPFRTGVLMQPQQSDFDTPSDLTSSLQLWKKCLLICVCFITFVTHYTYFLCSMLVSQNMVVTPPVL